MILRLRQAALETEIAPIIDFQIGQIALITQLFFTRVIDCLN